MNDRTCDVSRCYEPATVPLRFSERPEARVWWLCAYHAHPHTKGDDAAVVWE